MNFLASATAGKLTAIFLDLEKAFKLANEAVTLDLLTRKGVKGQLLRWTRDYLTDRRARVHFQGHTSSRHNLEHGTLQGSVHSPFLFNTVVKALLLQPLPRSCSLMIYADDITLLATGRQHRADAQ